MTTLNIQVDPIPSTWEAVNFGDLGLGNQQLLSTGAIPNSSGQATMQYETLPGSCAMNDIVTASACGVMSAPLHIYQYYPYLNKSIGTTQFDIGQSQVSNSMFAASKSLLEQNIQTFFIRNSAWLSHFYLDMTNPDNGGWYDPQATEASDTFDPTHVTYTYCPYEDASEKPICPLAATDKGPADSGIRASAIISKAAETNNINPEVLLATLEKEYGVALATLANPPSDTALNQAMGVGNTDFQTQINAGAHTFNTRFTGLNDAQFPYFFAANATEIADYDKPPKQDSVTSSIQYSWEPKKSPACDQYIHTDCAIVAFWLANRATYAQYRYTPFVQTTAAGGGVRGFEYWWFVFASAGWYQ